MNNRTQRRFDKSIKNAARASGQAVANDRAARIRWERQDAAIATAPACDDMDAFVAGMVARDHEAGQYTHGGDCRVCEAAVNA